MQLYSNSQYQLNIWAKKTSLIKWIFNPLIFHFLIPNFILFIPCHYIAQCLFHFILFQFALLFHNLFDQVIVLIHSFLCFDY